MPSRSHIAALLALGGLTACAEPPSYELRWEIDGRGLPTVTHCADAGLFQIRTRTYVTPGVFVDERFYPCAPDALQEQDGTIAGPTLGPGHYAIQLRGVDRGASPWGLASGVDLAEAEHPGCTPDPDGSTPAECHPDERVCDCVRLDVNADGLGTLVDDVGESGSEPAILAFAIEPPGECEDGIDNDLDGLLDDADPACLLPLAEGMTDADRVEDTPVGTTNFEISLSLLGQNPNAECSGIPSISRVQIRRDFDDDREPEVLHESPCNLVSVYRFADFFDPGPTTFSVVIVDRDGQIITVPQTFEQDLREGGNTVRASVDFGTEDFLEPITSPMWLSLSFRGSRGLADGNPVPARPSCSPTDEQGSLAIAGLRVAVLDGHGGTLGETLSLHDGTPLDGQAVFDCTINLQTPTFDWSGGRSVTIEALSAEGEVCFHAEQLPIRPGGQLPLELPRVHGDMGEVPDSCRDCQEPADCPATGSTCVQGACQFACSQDSDCSVDGDAGFSCADDGVCAWSG